MPYGSQRHQGSDTYLPNTVILHVGLLKLEILFVCDVEFIPPAQPGIG